MRVGGDGGGLGLPFVEVAALLALATDHAFGQPSGTQLRACLLSTWMAGTCALSDDDRATTRDAALLRFLGCTGHAHEVAVVFGDEIAARARSLIWDQSSGGAALREVIAHGGEPRTGVTRVAAVLSILAGGRAAVRANFRTGCEVADALASRLGVGPGVREALGATFERWNGHGFPKGLKGEAICLPMRIIHLCQELEVLDRHLGREPALAEVRRRSGDAYDPALVDQLSGVGEELDRLADLDPWDEVTGAGAGGRTLTGDELEAAMTVVGDFADLKSPFTAGHSRGVAGLAASAGEEVGFGVADIALVRQAGLLHDLGRVGIPNSIWEKPGPLTRTERDRVQTHALLSEQLLRHTALPPRLVSAVGMHHERADGSGYHRGLSNAETDPHGRLLAAADAFHAMTEERPHRPALQPAAAAGALRTMGRQGRLDSDATAAVLSVAGQGGGPRSRAFPGGLTAREVEVLRLLALGLTTQQIAERLVIAAKTADHHVQHIYTKIGVSTRGAAALFAMEHDLVRSRFGA